MGTLTCTPEKLSSELPPELGRRIERRTVLKSLLALIPAGLPLLPLIRPAKNQTVIHSGLISPWRTIAPGQQSTLSADLVTSNIFEPLVGVNNNGNFIPLGARAWKISADFRKFKFNIDSKKVFPNGAKLTSFHYKSSWEEALRRRPLSSNNSLQDVLYRIEGYDAFKLNNSISGIVADDPNILEIHFKAPFRMALELLSSVRLAAFIQVGSQYLGTGPFNVTELGSNHLLFDTKSDDLREKVRFDFKLISYKSVYESLLRRELDFIPYISHPKVDPRVFNAEHLEIVTGPEAQTIAIGLNANSKIFKKTSNRRAFQYLVHSQSNKAKFLQSQGPTFVASKQVYLPLQAGRLPDSEAEKIIAEGKNFVDDFLKDLAEAPLKIRFLEGHSDTIDLIKSTGIPFSNDSEFISTEEYMKLLHSKVGDDAIVTFFSVGSSDPDGIYHKLGPNGSIRSPYIYSSVVGEKLEAGRTLINKVELDQHYRNVQTEILTEVPIIHLGFAKSLAIYNKDTISFDSSFFKRNFGNLINFRST